LFTPSMTKEKHRHRRHRTI